MHVHLLCSHRLPGLPGEAIRMRAMRSKIQVENFVAVSSTRRVRQGAAVQMLLLRVQNENTLELDQTRENSHESAWPEAKLAANERYHDIDGYADFEWASFSQKLQRTKDSEGCLCPNVLRTLIRWHQRFYHLVSYTTKSRNAIELLSSFLLFLAST